MTKLVRNSAFHHPKIIMFELCLTDIFETKPQLNNNHLEKDIANPPSTPGAIFGGEDAQLDEHDLLAG